MGSLRFALASARKDLLRRARDPLALLLWMGIPVVMGGLISLVFSSGGPRPRAHVLVVDRDESFLSRAMLGMLGSEQAGEVFRVEEVTLADGRARIEDGDGSALLVIPDGFAEALLREEPTTLELVTNPAQRILPGMVEEALSILVEGSFYLHRVLGDELREMIDGPEGDESLFPDARVADISVRINERMRRMERFLFPAVLTLAVAEAGSTEGEAEAEADPPDVSFGALFFPAMLFMGLFFVAAGLSDDVWREKAHGTLSRVVTTPTRTGAFLLGKVVAGAAVVALVCATGLVLALALFDFSPAPMGLALVWGTMAGSVLMLMMMLIQLFAASQRAGSLITNTFLFPLIMLGGSFFPFEAMPEGMAAIGMWTPNGWALVEFKWILSGGRDPARLAVDLAVAGAAGAVLFGLCARRLRGKFAQG